MTFISNYITAWCIQVLVMFYSICTKYKAKLLEREYRTCNWYIGVFFLHFECNKKSPSLKLFKIHRHSEIWGDDYYRFIKGNAAFENYTTHFQRFLCFDKKYCDILVWNDDSCMNQRMTLFFPDKDNNLKNNSKYIRVHWSLLSIH